MTIQHYILKDVCIHIDVLKKTKVREALIRKLHLDENKVKNFVVQRSSLDTRKAALGQIFYVYTATFDYLGKPPHHPKIELFAPPPAQIETIVPRRIPARPLIIGTGPAGLFCALRFLRAGVACTLLEQGSDMEKRTNDVRRFWQEGMFNAHSNASFGLGGAGTFSDGKLTTRIKTPYKHFVLDELVKAGAKPNIRYFAKPHLGTDNLRKIIAQIRDTLIEGGCTFRFETKVTGFVLDKEKTIKAVRTQTGEEIPASYVFFAPGNCARESFQMLADAGAALVCKPFSMGMRIEHEQALIDRFVYKQFAGHALLGPADYTLTYNDSLSKRGVYSFCNCPGGLVIASASEEGCVSTNGMSYSKRNQKNANAAIVVTVDQRDFGGKEAQKAIALQREIERKAFMMGKETYKAPVMTTRAFLGKSPGPSPDATYLPGVVECDLTTLFPQEITQTLKRALKYFSSKIEGFDNSILTAPETKTSSPVRMLRDANTRESTTLHGLYPIGEGSGYSGGIMSSACDGAKSADAVLKTWC